MSLLIKNESGSTVLMRINNQELKAFNPGESLQVSLESFHIYLESLHYSQCAMGIRILFSGLTHFFLFADVFADLFFDKCPINFVLHSHYFVETSNQDGVVTIHQERLRYNQLFSYSRFFLKGDNLCTARVTPTLFEVSNSTKVMKKYKQSIFWQNYLSFILLAVLYAVVSLVLQWPWLMSLLILGLGLLFAKFETKKEIKTFLNACDNHTIIEYLEHNRNVYNKEYEVI